MKFITVAGPPSSGKTSVIVWVLKALCQAGLKPAVGKIDSIETSDAKRYRDMGVPAVVGLSGDLCPDHYYVSNLEEIIKWAKNESADIAIIETAGLCHRCAPAIAGCLSIAVIDSLGGIDTPRKIGPVLSTADVIVITKGDIVSQAEREVFHYRVKTMNPRAEIIEVNGLTGKGTTRLKQILCGASEVDTLYDKDLRTTMPSCICSYCTGETRIGNAYQLGHVIKIEA
jgi:Ni2+-binding GTPase involved in maturation of urease and hydrogenase